MHIHPPKEAIRSLRHFSLELFTVTCGILIALSLEGLVESMHHRSLVKHARGTLQAECGENRKRLRTITDAIPGELKELEKLIRVCRKELAQRGSTDNGADATFRLSYSAGPLTTTAWSAAGSSGALARMDYEELRSFTRVYVTQEFVGSLQQQALSRWLQLQRLSLLLPGEDSRMKDLTPEELVDLKRNAIEAHAVTTSLKNCSEDLIAEYDQLLAGKR